MTDLPPKSQPVNAMPQRRRGLPLSKNMEYILHQEALAKGLDPTPLKDDDFSHLIIREVHKDKRMYLLTMVKRLNYCCPFPPPSSSHDDSSDPPQHSP